jgi:hypothetical protein
MSRPYTYEYLNIHIIHIHIHIHIHARLTVPRSTHAQGTSQNTPAANLLVLWLLPTMVWYWYGSTKYQTPHHTTPHHTTKTTTTKSFITHIPGSCSPQSFITHDPRRNSTTSISISIKTHQHPTRIFSQSSRISNLFTIQMDS